MKATDDYVVSDVKCCYDEYGNCGYWSKGGVPSGAGPDPYDADYDSDAPSICIPYPTSSEDDYYSTPIDDPPESDPYEYADYYGDYYYGDYYYGYN